MSCYAIKYNNLVDKLTKTSLKMNKMYNETDNSFNLNKYGQNNIMDNLIQELKQKYKLKVEKISNRRVEFECNNLKFSVFDKGDKILILKEMDGVNKNIWYDVKTLIKIFLNKKVEFIQIN